MNRSGIEVLLEMVVEGSGVMQGRSGKFTTHCFRRGGAQYRFMWAKRKWSLKAVKWWGGWSSSENVSSSCLFLRLTLLINSNNKVGTIMRYLLDELMAYEEGFTDMLMADRAFHRHETFMGIDPQHEDQRISQTPDFISRSDLKAFEVQLLQSITALVTPQRSQNQDQAIVISEPPTQAYLTPSSHSKQWLFTLAAPSLLI